MARVSCASRRLASALVRAGRPRRRAAISTSRPSCSRFVEAEPPPALAERGDVDVILTIDVDETGKVVKVDVAQVGRRRLRRGAPSGGAPVRVRARRGRRQAGAGAHHLPYKFLYKRAAAAAARRAGRAAAPAARRCPLDGPRAARRAIALPLGGVSRHRRRERASHHDQRRRPLPLRRRPGRHAHVCTCAAPSITKSDVQGHAHRRQALSTHLVRRSARSATARRCAASARWSRPSSRRSRGEELRHIPGTQGDTLKAVQNLPGVARAPFGGGQLVVWGSSPQRHAHLRRRRLHPDALPLRRPALDGEQRDGLVAAVPARRLRRRARPRPRRRHRDRDAHARAPTATTASCSSISSTARSCSKGRSPRTSRSPSAARRSWIDAFLPHLHHQRLPALADLLRLPGQAALARLAARRRRPLHLRLRRRAQASSPRARRPDAVGGSSTRTPTITASWRAGSTASATRATLTVTPSIGYDVPFQFKAQLRQHRRRHRRRDASRTTCARRSRLPLGALAAPRRRRRLRGQPLVTHRRSGAVGAACRARATRRRLRRRASPTTRSTLDHQHRRAVRRAQLLAAQEASPSRRSCASSCYRLPRLPGHARRVRPRLRRCAEPRLAARYQLNTWAAVKARRRRLPPAARSRRRSCRRSATRRSMPQYGWHYVARRRLRPDVDAAHRGAGLLQGSAQPGRARRERRRSAADQRRHRPRLRRRAAGAAGAVQGLLRLGLVHAVALGAAGSSRRSVAPVPVRPDAHPDHHRQLQVRARLSGRRALPLRHRQSLHAGRRRLLRRQRRPLRADHAADSTRRGSARSTSSTCASTRSGPSTAGALDLPRHPERLQRRRTPRAYAYNFNFTQRTADRRAAVLAGARHPGRLLMRRLLAPASLRRRLPAAPTLRSGVVRDRAARARRSRPSRPSWRRDRPRR